jgi:hypothetical protein
MSGLSDVVKKHEAIISQSPPIGIDFSLKQNFAPLA